MEKMTFMQACRDFFGLLPAQTSVEFAKEVKALSDADRVDIKAGLQQQGYEILTAPGQKA